MESFESKNRGISRRNLIFGPVIAAIAASCKAHACEAAEKKPTSCEVIEFHEVFDTAHALAYREFERQTKILLMAGHYTMSGFQTEIGKRDEKFFVRYKVRLNPAPNEHARHRVLRLDGTIKGGLTLEQAKMRVDKENHKKWYGKDPNKDNTNLIEYMKALIEKGGGTNMWQEDAEHSFLEGNIVWYHKAKLFKGN